MVRKLQRGLLQSLRSISQPTSPTNVASTRQTSIRLPLSSKNPSNDLFRIKIYLSSLLQSLSNNLPALSGHVQMSNVTRDGPPSSSSPRLVLVKGLDEASRASRVEAIIDYHFKNKSLLLEAMQAPGGRRERSLGPTIAPNHRRLAVLGDAIITFVVASDWYPQEKTRCK